MKHHTTNHLTHLAKAYLAEIRALHNVPHDSESAQKLEDILHEINKREERRGKRER